MQEGILHLCLLWHGIHYYHILGGMDNNCVGRPNKN